MFANALQLKVWLESIQKSRTFLTDLERHYK